MRKKEATPKMNYLIEENRRIGNHFKRNKKNRRKKIIEIINSNLAKEGKEETE